MLIGERQFRNHHILQEIRCELSRFIGELSAASVRGPFIFRHIPWLLPGTYIALAGCDPLRGTTARQRRKVQMSRDDEHERDEASHTSRRTFCAGLMLTSAGLVLTRPAQSKATSAQDSIAYPPDRFWLGS